MIDWPAKEPAAVSDYAVDFAARLASGETISTRTVTAVGVTKNSDSVSGAIVTAWLSGGTQGTLAKVTVTVTTNQGRTFSELALLPIGGGPIDLARAKAHLRVDFDTEDSLIAAYLRGAVAAVEARTGRILSPRVIEQRSAGFIGRDGSRRLTLLHDPVTAIVSVTYVDATGATQTLAAGQYRSIEGEPWSVIEAVGASWPATDVDRKDAVKVRYAAGYEAGDTPADLQSAVLLMLGHLYMNREAVVTGTISTDIPLGVEMLCAPWRRVSIG